MGDIFGAAVFTIIALGKDAASGLDGISRPFLPRHQIRSRGQTYVSSGHTLQHFLKGSSWASRAWVYQEAVLSKLCLILTPEQAFCISNNGGFSETLPMPTSEKWKAYDREWMIQYVHSHQQLGEHRRTATPNKDRAKQGQFKDCRYEHPTDQNERRDLHVLES